MTRLRDTYANSWRRIRPTAAVFAAIVVSLAVYAVSADAIGRNFGQFLKLTRAPTFEEATAAVPIEYALESTEENDVIFLGDSACLTGINPTLFKMASGLRAYNLGSLYAVGSEGMLVTCQAYLAKHPPPQLIVLCLSPENSQYPAADSPFALQFVRTYGRSFQHPSRGCANGPGSTSKQCGKVPQSLRTIFCALVSGNFDFRNSIVQGFSRPDTYSDFAAWRGVQRGYNPLPAGTNSPSDFGEFPEYRVPVLPEWRQGARDFARLVIGRRIHLLVRFAPIRVDARSENFGDVITWLRDLQKEFPEADIKTEILFYEPSLFYDRRHLSAFRREQVHKARG